MRTTAEKTVAALKDAALTLAAAESCTGGLIAKQITDVSGASAVFHGGVVSYVNEVKHRILKVSQKDLDTLGAVSEPVARQMAAGARRALGTDLAVSVTGVAGPGRDDRDNPVGLVFIALAFQGGTHCRECHFNGSRDEIRHAAAETALSLVLSYLGGELTDNTFPAFTEANYDALLKELYQVRDPKYQVFHSNLLPGVDDLIGVRTPALRLIAKQLLRLDWEGYLSLARSDSYEERMLQGLVIAGASCSLSKKFDLLRTFIPKIDNWAICDMVASTFRWKEAELPAVWEFFEPYLHSDGEFEVRFALVQLMDYFYDDVWIDRSLEAYRSITHPGYYVTMALGWGLSAFFVHQREKVLVLLESGVLSAPVQNTAIRKCCESLRLSKEDKAMLRTLRKKEP